MADEFLLNSPGRFPSTRKSAVLGSGSDDPAVRARAFDVLVRAYYKPVYKHVRVRWRKESEEAEELVQEFFSRMFEKRTFAGYDASQALFRTYLKMLLDRFLAKADRGRRRIKRGGGSIVLSLDFEGAEAELARSMPTSPEGVEATFDQEWTRSLMSLALDALRERAKAKGKEKQLAIFEAHALRPGGEPPSYAELAAEHGATVVDVTNWLAAMRRELRRAVLDKLREVTASEEEFQSEARALLGPVPRDRG